MGGEPEPDEGLDVEKGVNRLDAVATQLEHLERPRSVATCRIDSVLGEGGATIGLARQQT